MADCCRNGTCSGHIPLKEIIAECDRLFNLEKKDELEKHLLYWRRQAAAMNDKQGELAILNEMMGLYRMMQDEFRGLAAIRDGFDLIDTLGIADTVSAGTIFINGATALQSFGCSSKAISYYKKAEKCYQQHLDPEDSRFAALYNNMASVFYGTEEIETAEKYYLLAAGIQKKNTALMDLAVTYVNLAQLYDALDPEDVRIEQNLDLAFECFENSSLPRDGYYAHTCRKCAPAFGYFGRFMDEAALQKRAEDFYAGH